ncbi:putative 37S ribosomal protein mrp10, mitochondrial [Seiridium unicorne]|uniref:37S ribosomal protein mrp10, mitochondrial n=1 Tax=Seiridium unicorne TaxID=138068 RepID=A0ABR2UJJ9_9PEZI
MSGTQKPMRLPPLKVLRVKNPNRQGERPCMAIMSSVLVIELLLMSLENSMLGISRIQHGRMRTDGAGIEGLYGRTAAFGSQEERDQLPSFKIPIESCWRQEAIRGETKGCAVVLNLGRRVSGRWRWRARPRLRVDEGQLRVEVADEPGYRPRPT